MEDSRKNNDCYFYYYSTCLKGDECTFRHEPAARGSETVCSFWAQGKCGNTSCNFRHMELKKNRKTIPCYWESQPSGCRKSHCPFQHKGSRDAAQPDSDHSNDCDGMAAAKPLERTDFRNHRPPPNEGRDSSEDGSRRGGGGQEFAPVDPLVVRFEEESDSESAPPPTRSPLKPARAATQEELHLLRIQAEAAAFYSYDSLELPTAPPPPPPPEFRVLSLAEIRGVVKRPHDVASPRDDGKRRRGSAGGGASKRGGPATGESEGKVRRTHSPIRFQEAEPSIRPGGRAVRLRRPASATVPAAGIAGPEVIPVAPQHSTSQACNWIPGEQNSDCVGTAEDPAASERHANGNGLQREDRRAMSEELADEDMLLGNTTMQDEEILDEDALLGD